ncbi:MAG: type 4a pilus biogenesis protein PilO [Candidatus Ratteibacteria bacterium]|nr:type 4a pilus biogenesis protein PilO [Candidatus Ratteibacteria bacterium]
MLKIRIPELDKAQLNKLLIIAGFILLLIFGSFFLIFKPQMKSIRDYRSRSDSVEKKILKAKEKIVRKPQLLAEIDEIKESLSQYEKKLPREKDIPVLLEELTEIVELAEIEFVSIRPQRTSSIEELAGKGGEGAYLRLPIEIQMRCGFHDLERFLFRLEKTKRFVKVVKLKIKGGGSKENLKHAVKLIIEVYMYQETVPLT